MQALIDSHQQEMQRLMDSHQREMQILNEDHQQEKQIIEQRQDRGMKYYRDKLAEYEEELDDFRDLQAENKDLREQLTSASAEEKEKLKRALQQITDKSEGLEREIVSLRARFRGITPEGIAGLHKTVHDLCRNFAVTLSFLQDLMEKMAGLEMEMPVIDQLFENFGRPEASDPIEMRENGHTLREDDRRRRTGLKDSKDSGSGETSKEGADSEAGNVKNLPVKQEDSGDGNVRLFPTKRSNRSIKNKDKLCSQKDFLKNLLTDINPDDQTRTGPSHTVLPSVAAASLKAVDSAKPGSPSPSVRKASTTPPYTTLPPLTAGQGSAAVTVTYNTPQISEAPMRKLAGQPLESDDELYREIYRDLSPSSDD